MVRFVPMISSFCRTVCDHALRRSRRESGGVFERSVRHVSGLEYLVNDRAGKITASREDHLQMTGSINDEGAKVVVEEAGLWLKLHIRQPGKFGYTLGAA